MTWALLLLSLLLLAGFLWLKMWLTNISGLLCFLLTCLGVVKVWLRIWVGLTCGLLCLVLAAFLWLKTLANDDRRPSWFFWIRLAVAQKTCVFLWDEHGFGWDPVKHQAEGCRKPAWDSGREAKGSREARAAAQRLISGGPCAAGAPV